MERIVMDFYCIARIIKLNMKNVIFYVGNNHVERIKHILTTYFDFTIFREIEGLCYEKNKFDEIKFS